MKPRSVNRRSARPSYTGYNRGYTRARPSRPRLKTPKLPTFSGSWIKIAALVTLVLVVLVIIAKLTALTHVTVGGNRTLTADHINTLASAGLKQQWFGRNLLLTNTNALENAIMQAEPAVKTVSVKRHPLHTISITVSERQPSLNWKTGETTYLLDVDGTVIGPTQGEYAKLPTVTDTNNLPVKVGQRVAPRTFVLFCQQIAAQLPIAGFPLTGLSVPNSTSEVYAQTGALVLKFDTTRPAGEEIADLKLVQKELTRSKKTPTQYIDLRIEHKAYYK